MLSPSTSGATDLAVPLEATALAPVPFDVLAAVRAACAALDSPPGGNEWYDMVDQLGKVWDDIGKTRRSLAYAMIDARVFLTEEHVGSAEIAGAWTALGGVTVGVAPDALHAVQNARIVLAASPIPAGRAAVWHEALTDVLNALYGELRVCMSFQSSMCIARMHLAGGRPQQALQELDSDGATPVVDLI